MFAARGFQKALPLAMAAVVSSQIYPSSQASAKVNNPHLLTIKPCKKSNMPALIGHSYNISAMNKARVQKDISMGRLHSEITSVAVKYGNSRIHYPKPILKRLNCNMAKLLANINIKRRLVHEAMCEFPGIVNMAIAP